MTFRYALKRMIRTPWASLATVGLAAALCVLLSLLTDMRARQERELETVYDTMEIRCTVTSADGVRTDGLQLSSAIDCLIYDIEGYGLTDFIFDLDQKVTFVVKLEDKIIEDPPTLTAISSPAAVPAFRGRDGNIWPRAGRFITDIHTKCAVFPGVACAFGRAAHVSGNRMRARHAGEHDVLFVSLYEDSGGVGRPSDLFGKCKLCPEG